MSKPKRVSKRRVEIQKALMEQVREIRRLGVREGFNRAQYRHLQAIKAHLDAIGESECKTIGNFHPPGLHCFACTWNHLRVEVDKAVKFWSDEDLRNKALS